ncbi:TY-Chap domain-containing protein [Nocardia sp. NPDC004415]
MAEESWQWFAEELTWLLFTLPSSGQVALDGTGIRYARFGWDRDGFRGELVSGPRQFSPRGCDFLRANGWTAPAADHPETWVQLLSWPIRYEAYNGLVNAVAAVLRGEFGLGLAVETAAVGWVDGTEEELDTGGLAGLLGREELNSRGPAQISEFLQASRADIAAKVTFARQTHEARMDAALRYCTHHGYEVLSGGDTTWPVRDRTADVIGLAEPDLLVVIDVYLDIESMADYPQLQVDAAEMEYDELFAMVEADPDLAARRPDVREGVASGRIQVQYVRMIIDEDWDCQVATYPPASAGGGSELSDGPWYPLLKPADWEHRHRITHWATTAGTVPIIVLAVDTDSGYQVEGFGDDVDSNALLAEAMANLAALEYDWEVSELHGLPLATSSGNDFSAEKVLDPKHMLRAHHALRTDKLLVAVPRRTCLMAVPFDLEPHQIMLFEHLVRVTYEDDSYGNAPITSGVYIVENGRAQSFLADL